MKKIFLLACLLAGTTIIVFAQQDQYRLRIGVAAQGILSNTDGDQLQLGTGQQLQGWLRYATGSNNGLELAVGYRRLSGYDQRHIRYEERHYPTEYQLEVDSRQLVGLSYLDASLSYYRSFSPSSRWSGSLGVRFSKLNRVKGESYRSVYHYSSYYDRITEESLSGGSGSGPAATLEEPLPEGEFSSYDLALRASLFFQLTPGLQLKASIDQGFIPVFSKNLFPTEEQYYVTALALGFSAQIW